MKLPEHTKPIEPQLLKSISVFTHDPDAVRTNPDRQATVAKKLK